MLGAGGAARAAVWALLDAGAAEVSVWNRTAERAAAVASDLGARPVARPVAADLVVNCTVVGLGGEELGELALEGVEPGAIVVDMVYADGATPVQEWAERGGARFVGGLEVLVHQGARSLQLWTGREAPVEVMRAAAGAEHRTHEISCPADVAPMPISRPVLLALIGAILAMAAFFATSAARKEAAPRGSRPRSSPSPP